MEELQNLLPSPHLGYAYLKQFLQWTPSLSITQFTQLRLMGLLASDQALLNQQQFLPMIGSPLHSKSKFSSKIY